MAQYSNEHLTVAQLSAYLDQEMTPDEQAVCDAHVKTCQPCQGTLSDLRITSNLLRGMSRVEVPRSFVLPDNLTILPRNSARAVPPVRLPRRGQPVWKRSLRALSTVAAVLGLVFILAGAFTALPHGGLGINGSAAAPALSSNSARTAPIRETRSAGNASPNEQGTERANTVNTPTPSPTTTASRLEDHGSGQQREPALPNLDQTQGFLVLGAVLFLLGMLGLVLMRHSRRNPRSA